MAMVLSKIHVSDPGPSWSSCSNLIFTIFGGHKKMFQVNNEWVQYYFKCLYIVKALRIVKYSQRNAESSHTHCFPSHAANVVCTLDLKLLNSVSR